MSDAIDITPRERKTLDAYFARYIPGVEVWAYGSRVKWTARPDSDLDLVVFSKPEQSARVAELKDALAESDLPFRVDLHVWDEVPESFREIIRREYVVVDWNKKNDIPLLKTWRDVAIEAIADRIAMGPFGSDIKTDNFREKGVPVIRGCNLGSGRFCPEGFVYVSEKKADELINANAFPDDIVITHRGTLGQVGIIPRNLYPRYIVSQSQMKIACRRDVVDPAFLYYFFVSPSGRFALLCNTSQTGVPAISRPVTSIKSIHLSLPPLSEQKAIAAILGALDDKIELNRKMNATLEAMAQALFKSWFVDFDPVRAKSEGRIPVGMDQSTADLFPDSFEDSDLGQIPTGWKTIPLYETARYVNGAAFRNEDFCTAGQGLPVIKIGELKDGISAQTKWSQRHSDPNQIISTGDLIYSWSGSPDTSLDAFLWSEGKGLLNQHIFKVITPSPTQKRFVYYLLKYLRPVLVEIARDKQTTGLGHVTVADMKRLTVVWPIKQIIEAFDRIAAPLFDQAFANTLESRTLATIRDTLLPKLLSGEISVADIKTARNNN
jgi:type I restriction enzyme S subunit